MVFVSHQYISSPGWSWTAVIVCLGICAIVIMGIEGRRLVIETTGGAARYPVADLFEEAEGFVLSANALLGLEAFEPDSNGEKDEAKHSSVV